MPIHDKLSSACNTSPSKVDYLWLVFLCLLIVTISYAYSGRLDSGFVGIMEYQGLHRALNETIPDPLSLFATPHQKFGYRPLSDGMVAIWAKIGDGSPRIFLYQNLLFHIVATLLLVWVSTILFESKQLALVVGALFALHPTGVSMVGVPGFGGLLLPIMLLTVLAIVNITKSNIQQTHWQVLLLILAAITPWYYEGFLWLTPIIAATFVLSYLRHKKRAWVISGISALLISTATYLYVREKVISLSNFVGNDFDQSTYGIRSFGGLIENIAIHQFGTAMFLDYMSSFNPLYETIQRFEGVDSMIKFLPSVLSALFACLIVYGVILYGLIKADFRSKAFRIVLGTFLFFWMSVAIQLVFAQSTEFYVYISRPFWAILFVSANYYIYTKLNRYQSTLKISAFAVVGAILLLFTQQTKSRVLHLNAKADLIKDHEEKVHSTLKDNTHQILVVLSCNIPSGFSIYGANAASWWRTYQWSELAFGADRQRLTVRSAKDLAVAELFGFESTNVLFVDDNAIVIQSIDMAANSIEECNMEKR